MNKAKCARMRMAIAEALARVALEHGDTVKVGNISYSETGLRATVHVDEISENGLPAKYKKDWDDAVRAGYVLDEHFGVETMTLGVRYKVVGYDWNKPKNCIKLERQDNGKIYMTTMRHFNNPAFKKDGEIKSLQIGTLV
jgi:hypothetical protein